MKNNAKTAAKVAAVAAFPGLSLAMLLSDLAVKAVSKIDGLEVETTPQLREIAERQELEQRINQAKAKVAQEYAIAARIQTALEVEMEEFYEYVGEGGISAQGNINTGDLGVDFGGGVRRLNKRVYRFKGGNVTDSYLPEFENIESV